MTDEQMEQPAEEQIVSGGGLSPAERLAQDPIYRAAAQLELLSPDTREHVLSRMDPEIAQQLRDHLASQPENRPHGQFSTDVATRRQMINQLSHSVSARAAQRTGETLDQLAPGMPANLGMPELLPPVISGAQQASAVPTGPVDPLDELRTLHPAAIARAMQGERAEAWAIVLDRLDTNARAALQLYLDAAAREAIDDARARQAELKASAPALLGTVVAAIARTVVPRAIREHHQLLTNTPMAWAEQ